MANNQDARPFVDLKKDAEEFRMKFDDDIKECLRFLDTKITALICDPDSFGTSGRSIHQNALAEFSKAKYSIFIGAKTLINAKEREWLTYITEMKKLFIENVEIFLAGTKLEVKLPPSESMPSQGPRKSPGNLKSSTASVTSAIYPILSTITKNIPGLGSSFLERDARSAVSKAYAGEKTQFNRRGRLSASSIKLANSSYEEEEMDSEEVELDQNVTQRTTIRGRKAVKPMIEEEMYEPGPSKSPKKVSFGGDQSSSDELDIQTPLARPVKSAARRKTLLPKLDDLSGADIIPGSSSRTKAKRKTISDVTELETVASSKRLKVSQKTISSQEEDSSADDNLLESEGNYSEWMSLKSVDGKIPTRPAIYEVKVWRAKKPAYIGSCENLRQKLTLYNLRQNSGHKHLDKFIDRNFNEIQVRFEVVSSFNDAKQEVKNRIDSFKAQHKNPPAYN